MDRHIVRAIVGTRRGSFYFVRVCRDDIFGAMELLSKQLEVAWRRRTPEEAIHRGVEGRTRRHVEVLCKIGTVSDYYNQIHRHT